MANSQLTSELKQSLARIETNFQKQSMDLLFSNCSWTTYRTRTARLRYERRIKVNALCNLIGDPDFTMLYATIEYRTCSTTITRSRYYGADEIIIDKKFYHSWDPPIEYIKHSPNWILMGTGTYMQHWHQCYYMFITGHTI